MFKKSELSNQADNQKRQRLIGEYKKSCEYLLEYQARNPEDTSSREYKRLVSSRERSLDNLYNYQPALNELYPNREDFPIVDGKEVRIVDIGDILIDALRLSYERPDLSDKIKTEELNLDNIIAPVKISTYKKDANGNLVGDENGEAILEDMTVFALKGNSLEEVKQNLSSLFNTVAKNNEASIAKIKKEVEDITNLIPENNYGEEGDIYTNNPIITLEKFFGKTVDELSKSNFETEILSLIEQSKGQHVLKRSLSLINYSDRLSEFVDNLIGDNINQAGSYFGKFLADNEVNVIAENNKLEKHSGKNALAKVLFNTVAENLKKSYESAVLTNNQNDINLFNNAFRDNPKANESFNRILQESLDLTFKKLSFENAGRIPSRVFEEARIPQLVNNQKQSLPELLSNPDNYKDYLSNPSSAVNKLMGNEEVELDYYGQPVVRDVYYQEQPQLTGGFNQQDERNPESLTRDIAYKALPSEEKPKPLHLDLTNFNPSNFNN